MTLKYSNYLLFINKNKKYLILLIIFFVFLLLRCWLLSKTIMFGWDQERDAQIAEKIISHSDIPLIGPRVVGEKGFFLGPYFFYLITPFYFLTNLHPYAIVYFVIFFSTIFYVISFYIFQKLYGFKVAMLFLAIWAVLPATINQDRIAWNPMLIPLAFSTLIFYLDKFQLRPRYFLILGLILGAIFHIHFQGLFYAILALVYLMKKYPRSLRYYLWIILGFSLTFTPLIIFDFRHQWLNLNLFTNFFFSSTHTSGSPISFLPVWSNFVDQLTGINNLVFSIIIWLILVIYGFINRRRAYFFTFTIVLFITPIAFAVYGQRPSEYYFNFLLPIIILYLSIFISKKKIPPYILLLIFSIFSLYSLKSIKINPTSLFYKNEIVKKAKDTLKETPVYISYDTPLGENNGFDYLINYYKINRSKDTSRPGVQFIIPKKDNLPSFGNISLFIPEQFE